MEDRAIYQVNRPVSYLYKGRGWFYVGTGLMLICLAAFLLTVLYLPYTSLGIAYLIFLPFFLAIGIFCIYATTPLMSPTFGFASALAIFAASQVVTIFDYFGHMIFGLVIGHFAEFCIFAWANNKSRRLYEQQLL